MEKEDQKQEKATDLRGKAEEKLKPESVAVDNLSDEEARKLAHELQVHQIELEIQNEELRKAQILIEESRSEYTDLYDFAPVGYLTFNIDRKIVKSNLTITGMLGEERVNLNNKTFYRHIVKDDADIFHLHLQKIFRSKEKERCELRLKRRNDSLFYAQLNSIYVKDLEGNEFCRTSMIDITERKESEENIRMLSCAVDQQNKDLEIRNELLEHEINEHIKTKEKLLLSSQMIQSEKMNAMGTMVAGVAHELNNPMMGIINYVEYCRKRIPTDDRNHSILLKAEAEITRCIDIVSNLLTFSRMDKEGKEAYRMVDCSVIFERIFKLISYRIEKERVSVVKHYKEGAAKVWARADGIQQVFLILISNALDALNDSEKEEINIDIRQKGLFTQITVSDTGAGIHPENIDKIFDPFFTTKPVGNGTGLGLSILKSIIEEHKGNVTCKSKLGKGTEFNILLPTERTDN
ncbi:MAG: ATP-binding protein [Candidatus Anammoxibacter sp.]